MQPVAFKGCGRRAAVATYLSLALAAGALAGCSPPAGNAGQAGAPAASQAGPDEAAVYRGAAIAGQVCSQCHDIGGGRGPAIYAGAPAFKEVMARPGMTAEWLTEWMTSSHPSMPHYVFNTAETGDIVAFLMSLRERKPGDPA